MRDLDNHFGEYVHLKQLPREAEALTTLRKAASCVKPIMRKRGWRVGTLSEFLPEDSSLWGLNIDHGRQINLRLRHPGDSNQFLQFEHVLDTLLHELCHIVHGPHDEIFHKLWDELRDEWTSLQIKGFTGEGFLGKGQQVGGRRIPVDEVRRQARVAAEKRAKISKVQAPGKRLGGKAPKSGRGGIRETIARAALSRTKVETGCATGTKAGDKAAQRAAEDSRRNGFRTKAEMDDANSVAIAEAMQELMELDEERVIDISEQTPPSEGLTWSAEHGLQAAPPKVSPWPAPNPYGMNPRSGEPSPQAPIQQRSGPSSGSKKNPVPSSAASTSNSRGRPVSRVVLEAEAKKKQFQSLKSASTIKSEDLMTSSSQPSQSHSTRERWACLECTLPGCNSYDSYGFLKRLPGLCDFGTTGLALQLWHIYGGPVVDVYALLEDAAKFLIGDDTRLHLHFSVAFVEQLGSNEHHIEMS
ncbi:hypothetical protein EG328_008503 [Venturia inaequalis]|uniref:WLM domain-containing protein n=1 Tax=Venturia inaequalis TaxID=5025 RepID=A0A8H3YNB6_VENIN|nr:hypothetical protein EG328_008503 [Venturia inaequalis]